MLAPLPSSSSCYVEAMGLGHCLSRQENAHFPRWKEQTFVAYPTSLCFFPQLPSLPSLHPQTRADAAGRERAKYSYLSGNLPLFLTFCPTTLRDAERGREAEMMGREEGRACVPPRKTDSNKSPVKIRVSPRAARAVQQNMALLAW